MPPAGRGRGGRGGRGGGGGAPGGNPGGPPVPAVNPFLFSPAARSVPILLYVGVGGMAGPADNASYVAVPSDSDVVTRTPFAQWKPSPPAPDGIVRSRLTSAQMTRVFLWRCVIGPTPADRNAAAAANPFTGRLGADAWSRVLSSLLDNGLFSRVYNSWDEFEHGMSSLAIADTGPLQLAGNDWVPGDAFVMPPAGADPHLIERMGYLRFLTFATASFLEDPTNLSRPLENFCYLVGALGPCFAQPSREDEMASLHYVAQRLRDFICARAVPDGQAAHGLKRMISEIKLPPMLRLRFTDLEDLSSELLDSIQYANPPQRAAVEQRRIDILGSRLFRPGEDG